MTVFAFPDAEPVTDADLAPEFSDDALALEFSTRHADDLRYVAAWGAWLLWDHTRWSFEKTHRAFDLARAVARDFARVCNKPSDQRAIASATKVAAVERLAKTDRRHACTTDDFDPDPWTFTTKGSSR